MRQLYWKCFVNLSVLNFYYYIFLSLSNRSSKFNSMDFFFKNDCHGVYLDLPTCPQRCWDSFKSNFYKLDTASLSLLSFFGILVKIFKLCFKYLLFSTITIPQLNYGVNILDLRAFNFRTIHWNSLL